MCLVFYHSPQPEVTGRQVRWPRRPLQRSIMANSVMFEECVQVISYRMGLMSRCPILLKVAIPAWLTEGTYWSHNFTCPGTSHCCILLHQRGKALLHCDITPHLTFTSGESHLVIPSDIFLCPRWHGYADLLFHECGIWPFMRIWCYGQCWDQPVTLCAQFADGTAACLNHNWQFPMLLSVTAFQVTQWLQCRSQHESLYATNVCIRTDPWVSHPAHCASMAASAKFSTSLSCQWSHCMCWECARFQAATFWHFSHHQSCGHCKWIIFRISLYVVKNLQNSMYIH